MSDQKPNTGTVDWHLALASYIRELETRPGNLPVDLDWIHNLSPEQARILFSSLSMSGECAEGNPPPAKERR